MSEAWKSVKEAKDRAFKNAFKVVSDDLKATHIEKVSIEIGHIREQRDLRLLKVGLRHPDVDKVYNDLVALRDRSVATDDFDHYQHLQFVKDEARRKLPDLRKLVDAFLLEWGAISDQQHIADFFLNLRTGDQDWAKQLQDLAQKIEAGKPGLRKAVQLLEVNRRENAPAAVEAWKDAWNKLSDIVQQYKDDVLSGPAMQRFAKELAGEGQNGACAMMRAAYDSLPGSTALTEGKVANMLMRARALGPDIEVQVSNVSIGEALAVSEYTSGTYVAIADWLLKGGKPPGKIVLNTIDVLKATLPKLPTWTQWPLQRGDTKFPGWDEIYVQGKVTTLRHFWSTGYKYSFPGDIQFQILGKKKGTQHASAGKNVSPFSQHPNESEILFPPGTKFLVTKREDGEDGVVRFTVQEVD